MRLHFFEAMLLVGAAVFFVGCGAATTAGTRDVRISTDGSASTGVTQVELQQDLQRTATVFMDRVAQAIDPSASQARTSAEKTALMRRALAYIASALDIATGPYPEINALDMAVFAALCKGALETHWIPVGGFGAEGQQLLTTFQHLERDIWRILPRIIDAEKQANLRELIVEWQRKNPGQFLVEGVRFQQFAGYAGEAARAAKASGVMRQVKSAIRLGDKALLISERALFVTHRLPFLVRLQARVGVQETISDSLARVGDLEADIEPLIEKAPDVRPMLSDMTELTDRAGIAAHEARLLMLAMDPSLERVTAPENRELVLGMMGTLDSANRLADRSLKLVREMRGSLPSDPQQTLGALEQRADGVLRRWIIYLLILGFAWSLFFWSGYVLVKRLTS